MPKDEGYKLKFSYLIAAGCLIVHISYLYLVLSSNSYWPVKTILIILQVVIIIKYYFNNHKIAIISFSNYKNNIWHLHTKAGLVYKAVLKYPVYITNYLIILYFSSNRKPKKIFLLVPIDAISSAKFKQLKTKLLYPHTL